MSSEKEINCLIDFIKDKSIRFLSVDGPRGSGKTTACKNLLEASGNMSMYKTWGSSQRDKRHELEKLGLDLPQGTFFVLDFLSQIKDTPIILSDRGNLSALAYQPRQYFFFNDEMEIRRDLHRYYVELMRESNSALLVLDCDESIILERRIERKDRDEQNIYKLDKDYATRLVAEDCRLYDRAVSAMMEAGLTEELIIDLGGGTSGSILIPDRSTK